MASDQSTSKPQESLIRNDESDQTNATTISERLLSESTDKSAIKIEHNRVQAEESLPSITIIDHYPVGHKNLDADKAPIKDAKALESSEAKAGQNEERTVSWRGKEIILRSKDGVANYFRDKDGREWESTDGKRWSEKGADDAWHGSVSIGEDGTLRTINTSYGVNTELRTNGSLSTNFAKKDGKQVTLTEDPDGKRTLDDGTNVWQSNDGKTWKNGKSTQIGAIHIDEYGRLRKNTGRTEISLSTSAETQGIMRTMWRMENDYNVKFALPGEIVAYSDDNKTKVPMRLPTATELKVVEEVLEQFKHLSDSAKKIDFDGFRIGFTAYKDEGKKVNVAGWHDNEPASVYFGPSVFKEARGWKGLEGVALHEFSHELQNVIWKENEIPQKVLDFFGYEKAPKMAGEEDDSYRLRDKDGKQWQYLLTNKTDADGIWMPVKDGVMSTDRSEGISDKEMRKRLPDLQKPASEYFYDPAEAHAEALALYLHEPNMLYDANPNLYWAVKQWDQDDINRRFKTTRKADGSESPVMIRGTDGKIVPNTEENSRKVKDFENTLFLTPPTNNPTEAHKEGICNCTGHRKTTVKNYKRSE